MLSALAGEDATPDEAKMKVKKRDDGLMVGPLSHEDYNEWRNSTTEGGAPPNKRAMPVAHDVEDQDYVVNMIAEEFRDESQQDVGPRLKSGVSYTYEVQESTSHKTEVTTEFGAAFDIFTASMVISLSQEDTFSISGGFTFDVECKDQGQAYFYPLFDYYSVNFTNGEDAEVWVPVQSGESNMSAFPE